VVGVLATPATFQGALYASVVERFANGVELLQSTCPGLVQQIEKGDLEGAETRRILEEALLPMLEKNIDTVVLGCTHYPFVIPLIQRICGESVRVIDPAPSVAKQVERLLEAEGKRNLEGEGRVKFYTSGEEAKVESLLPKLLGEAGTVERVEWIGDARLVKP
jgi:glutamate racemase